MTRHVLALVLPLLTACPPVASDDTGDTSTTQPFDPDDADGDGYSEADGDCDDTDPNVNPGATDVPYDGADQDCDGSDLLDVDGDGSDTVWFGGDDCDDEDADIYPGATEICGDDIDQDCSGDPDDGATDADGDGYVDWACTGGDDCDDSSASIQPGLEINVPSDYSSVAEAVAAACSGSSITVSAGTYSGNVDGEGKALTLVGESGAELTILEGDGTDSVVLLGDDTGETVFSGFTVIGGAAVTGGGLSCTGACTVEDSVFDENTAEFGGGLALVDAEFSVASCSFHWNAAVEGAGIYIESANGSVSDVTFDDQVAERNGGGASVWYSAVDFTSITATGVGAAQGGGLFLYLHEGTVSDSSFDDCRAALGGGIWSREDTLELSGNVFSNNWSEYGGGGYYCWDSTVTSLESNTFEGNTLEDTAGPSSNTTPDGVVNGYDCDDYTSTPCIDVGCRSCYGCE